MANRGRRYSDEERADIIAVFREADETIAAVARRFEVDQSTLAKWLKQDDVDNGKREGVSSDVLAENAALKKELKLARMEVEFLKKVRAFFATENP